MVYYSVELSQAHKVTTEDWVIYSFDLVLANLGGYTALVWVLVGAIIDNYNQFHFESQVVRRLYTMDKKV